MNTLALNAGLKVSQTGSKITVVWGKLSDADGYRVYVQYCGKKFTSKSLTQVKCGKQTSITITKVNGKKLDQKWICEESKSYRNRISRIA